MARAKSQVLIGEVEEEPPNPMEDPIQRLARSETPAAAAKDTVLVTPQAGFVIKTTNAQGKKVFINVCGAEEVDAPDNWADGKMPAAAEKALRDLGTPGESSSDVETLRFPLSMGELRDDADHTGAACHVVDVVFNIAVLQQAALTRRLKIFIINLLLTAASQKHGTELDQEHYKLPRMRYKGGSPPSQCIRKEAKPLISEVASDAPAGDFAFRFDKPKAGGGSTAGHKSNSRPSSAESKMAPVAAPALAQPAPEPTQPSQGPAPGLQHRLDFEGCPATAAMVVVDSAALRSCTLSDVAVEACADTVLVRVGQQQAEVKLPCAVDAAAADATFDARAGSLRLRLPVVRYSEYLQLEQQPQTAAA